MRDGIESNAANWKDCTMYVQDIQTPGINVTAEISKEETNNFKKMCQIFTGCDSHNRCINEYISKLSSIGNLQSASKANNGSNCSLKSSHSTSKSTSVSSTSSTAKQIEDMSVFSLESLKNAIQRAQSSPRVSSEVLMPTEADNRKPSASKSSDNLFKIDDVSKSATTEMLNLLTRSENRIRDELQIIETLSNYSRIITPTINVIPFGSSTYGIGGLKTDFNLSIEMGKVQ